MNLVIIVLVAAIIIAMVIISNSSKNTADETPESLEGPNLNQEEEVAQTVVSEEKLDKLEEDKVKFKKTVKDPAVKKTAKPVAKTSAKPAPKKTVVKKNK